ncbi:MAG TPA: KpsF/GutQ family sugar-phosphate isomerase [Aquabacterium sp.]|nr:KpsF/GutQ family sugar-phosphate isomerase [Aquabacterium sp.]HQC94958.1 KpsF/GutQ family sugar-phosphate isomerase [Aquabacterium sp.]
MRALALAAQTFEIEARGLLGLAARQGAGFSGAVAAMLACRGRVVVMGMGKSGHVGRKIAATLASTGTPAFFVHPAEASHGDLGMVQPGDVVLAISNSGESDELAAVLPALRRLGITLVAMTGKAESTLARHADLVLDSAVDQEACPLNLAPTASTTAQMALGDALAVALLDLRGFKAEDFARSHPGGALGRKLLVLVADLMVRGDALPRVAPEAPFIDMMRTMSAKGLGAALVVDGDDRLLGIFTDGDLRRQVERGADLRALTAGAVMHANPKRIGPDALAAEGADLMEQHRITSLAVADAEGRLVGMLTIGDLMRAKVV